MSECPLLPGEADAADLTGPLDALPVLPAVTPSVGPVELGYPGGETPGFCVVEETPLGVCFLANPSTHLPIPPVHSPTHKHFLGVCHDPGAVPGTDGRVVNTTDKSPHPRGVFVHSF